MKFTIEKKDYYLRLGVIMLAVISPFICLIVHGYEPSISSYWRTNLQPLFILANAATSYYLYSIKDWKYSAYGLLLLTAFSVELYPAIHNFIAILFFLANIIPLTRTNHFKWCIYPYLSSLVVLPFSMTYSEIIAILSLCLYHYLMLRKAYNISQA